MPVLYPKFLQGFCTRTHPCNLGTHTVELTLFHPPLDTTTLAIVINGVQRCAKFLDTARRYSKISSSVFLFSLSHSSAVFSLSLEGGSTGLGSGLGLRFIGLGWVEVWVGVWVEVWAGLEHWNLS